jgi:hypothetical protein
MNSNLRIADKLLAFISSRQEIPLNGPNNIFSLLDNFFMKNKFQDCIIDNNVYYEWLSNMEEMGYFSISWGKKKISIQAPAIYRSAINQDRYFISGASIPEIIELFIQQSLLIGINLEIINNGELYPTMIAFNSDGYKVQKFAKALSIQFYETPWSYIILNKDIPLSDIMIIKNDEEELFFESTQKILEHIMERSIPIDIENHISSTRFFNPKTLQFNGTQPSVGNEVVLGEKNIFGKKLNLFYLDGDIIRISQPISRRYGKIFCLSKNGLKIGYSLEDKELYVPKICRLPQAISSAIARCSESIVTTTMFDSTNCKKLKYEVPRIEMLVYKQVPQIFVEIISTKLCLEIKYINRLGV